MKKLCFIITIALFLGCSRSTTIQNEEARKAMVKLMNSYVDDLKERNAEKTIAHFLNSPEFMFYSDGKRQGYNEIVVQVRDLCQNLNNYQGQWDTIFISVLNPNAVAALAPFHEVLTDKNGVDTRLKGEVTWIAVRVEKDWKFIYAYASYLPIEKSVPNSGISKGLNQTELLKKFVGNWEIPAGKDTTQFVYIKSLQGGNGLSVYSKWVTKGKMLSEGTGFWAYNAEINKIDISFMHSNGYVFHDLGEFTSPNTFEYLDVNKVTKVVTKKTKFEFISSNEVKVTDLENNKTPIYKWKHIK